MNEQQNEAIFESVESLTEWLYDHGWKSPCDAQHANITKLHSAIAALRAENAELKKAMQAHWDLLHSNTPGVVSIHRFNEEKARADALAKELEDAVVDRETWQGSTDERVIALDQALAVAKEQLAAKDAELAELKCSTREIFLDIGRQERDELRAQLDRANKKWDELLLRLDTAVKQSFLLKAHLATAQTALRWIRNCADSDEGTYVLISAKANEVLVQIAPEKEM